MSDQQVSVVYAGGGTGGHIFPAVAIAERLRARTQRGVWQWLVCSDRTVDALAAEPSLKEGTLDGATPIGAKPFGVRPATLARFVWTWNRTMGQARRVLASSPTRPVVVATGGFVAAPVVAAARSMRLPVILVSLDAVPGKASGWIAKRSDVVFDACLRGERDATPSRWEHVEPLVRNAARPNPDRARACGAYGLDPGKQTLLVTGGSQGARSVTDFVIALLEQTPQAWAGWQAIHQCGQADRARLVQAYENAGIHASVHAFLPSMSDALGAADLQIGRAGAGTVAEARFAGVPSIFFPYPYHRDEHQRRNAQSLVESGQALVFKDHVDAHENRTQHGNEVERLLREPARVASMRRDRCGEHRDGALEIADRILSIRPGSQ